MAIGGSGVTGKLAPGAFDQVLSFLEVIREPDKYKKMIADLLALVEQNRREVERLGKAHEIDRLHERAQEVLADARGKAQELEHIARTKLDEGERKLSVAWQEVKTKQSELDRLLTDERKRLDERTAELNAKTESLSQWEVVLLQMEKDLHEVKRHFDDLRAAYESKCAKLTEAMR